MKTYLERIKQYIKRLSRKRRQKRTMKKGFIPFEQVEINEEFYDLLFGITEKDINGHTEKE